MGSIVLLVCLVVLIAYKNIIVILFRNSDDVFNVEGRKIFRCCSFVSVQMDSYGSKFYFESGL